MTTTKKRPAAGGAAGLGGLSCFQADAPRIDRNSPPTQAKFVNGEKSDNRILNLRPANRSQNLANSRRRATNTSGFKGVSLHRQRRKWAAKIVANGTQIYLGLFNSP